MWVDYWELDEPHRRGPAGRGRRLRRALARHLRRGPAAQRLAARARPAPRLGELRRRVPALSHERRPRGHAATRCSSTTSPARTCARPRSPPGSRSATPTTAARCWRRRSSTPKLLDAGRRLAQGAPRDRGRPAARRAPGGGAASARRAAQRARRDRRQPGALPRAQAPRRRPRRRRADGAGADAHGRATIRDAAAALLATAGSARCRPTSRPGPGRASPSRRR